MSKASDVIKDTAKDAATFGTALGLQSLTTVPATFDLTAGNDKTLVAALVDKALRAQHISGVANRPNEGAWFSPLDKLVQFPGATSEGVIAHELGHAEQFAKYPQLMQALYKTHNPATAISILGALVNTKIKKEDNAKKVAIASAVAGAPLMAQEMDASIRGSRQLLREGAKLRKVLSTTTGLPSYASLAALPAIVYLIKKSTKQYPALDKVAANLNWGRFLSKSVDASKPNFSRNQIVKVLLALRKYEPKSIPPKYRIPRMFNQLPGFLMPGFLARKFLESKLVTGTVGHPKVFQGVDTVVSKLPSTNMQRIPGFLSNPGEAISSELRDSITAYTKPTSMFLDMLAEKLNKVPELKAKLVKATEEAAKDIEKSASVYV